MAITVTKRVRRVVNGELQTVYTDYQLYTVDEARAKGIEFDGGWRAKFRDQVDLTGTNIVTDDDPPYVVPVVACSYIPQRWKPRKSKKGGMRSAGGVLRRLVLPWTHLNTWRRPLKVGVPAYFRSQDAKKRIERVKMARLKLFVIMLALMVDPLKAVRQIFGLSYKVDQERFLECVMASERVYQAAESVAKQVLSAAGVDPIAIARALNEMFEDDKIDAALRVKIGHDLLDRSDVTGKSVPDFQAIFAHTMVSQPESTVSGQLQDLMDREARKLPGGDDKKRLKAGEPEQGV